MQPLSGAGRFCSQPNSARRALSAAGRAVNSGGEASASITAAAAAAAVAASSSLSSDTATGLDCGGRLHRHCPEPGPGVSGRLRSTLYLIPPAWY